jgi:hypothetical protein
VQAPPASSVMNPIELALRMSAGALLTVVVTLAASSLGQAWSGLLSVFPVMGIVLSVFSHRTFGAAYAALMLKGMMAGMFSFAGFCAALSLALPDAGVAVAFVLAVAVAAGIQLMTRRRSTRRGAALIQEKA